MDFLDKVEFQASQAEDYLFDSISAGPPNLEDCIDRDPAEAVMALIRLAEEAAGSARVLSEKWRRKQEKAPEVAEA